MDSGRHGLRLIVATYNDQSMTPAKYPVRETKKTRTTKTRTNKTANKTPRPAPPRGQKREDTKNEQENPRTNTLPAQGVCAACRGPTNWLFSENRIDYFIES